MRFDSYELDVPVGELRRGGERIRLQRQPFEILAMMLERPGGLVTREELVQRLWPQGTFVDFEHSLNAAVRRLRVALGDDPDNPRYVETLPRRGYRFIAHCDSSGDDGHRHRRARVAVLAFTDYSHEPGPGGFGDGLTDETIVQLGRVSGQSVDLVARSSSMAFASGDGLARDIGATLRADYLLEGTVRYQRDRARIAAWLVETAGETQLWSDVYDRCLADALSVQTDVASRIAASLASEISTNLSSLRGREWSVVT